MIEIDPLSDIQKQAACDHLCGAISIPTVSAVDAPENLARFQELHAFLEKTYPLIHTHLTREKVLEDSLLFHWEGTDKSRKPFALLGHLDVVPVEPGTESDWKHPPFQGTADGEFIYGRGAGDMKNHVIALFEAVEILLERDFRPDRDIYLCFGHNEEILGVEHSGAKAMANILSDRGIHMEFVLDEGGAVMTDSFLGISGPVATIGVAEKGLCDLKVSVAGPGGHAAEPPEGTATLQLAKLLNAMKPLPLTLNPTVEQTLQGLGSGIKGLSGFAMSHPAVFFPLIKKKLAGFPMVGAMLHTTWAATILRAGTQANVLPQSAEVIINARILPGETDQTMVSYINAVAKRQKITCAAEVLKYSPPPSLTSTDSTVYGLLGDLARTMYGATPVPYLMTGATDSREYAGAADEIYRFYPFAVSFSDLAGIHGTNERIRCSSLAQAISYMEAFIKTVGGAS